MNEDVIQAAKLIAHNYQTRASTIERDLPTLEKLNDPALMQKVRAVIEALRAVNTHLYYKLEG
jgi:hypothetical protein